MDFDRSPADSDRELADSDRGLAVADRDLVDSDRRGVSYLGAIVDDVLVVVVPSSIIDDAVRSSKLLASLGREAVLVSPTRRARMTFYGRADLADAVWRAPLDRVQWRRFVIDD